mgnify:CR=1 FL=1|tara:strand:+ start:98 stop:907 length:810 start_codon:yes stop_codon:yes gene_type:complete
MPIKFKKTVSKGSRFNQIYVPKNMENLVEVGDKVEVRLIKKHANLYYSKGLKGLSEFKENLTKDIFSFLNKIPGIGSILVVGSFLTEKINYNDIDLILITNKVNNKFEETAYTKLIEKFNLKFHVLAVEEKRFWHLLKICPLTKAMLTNFISNKPIKIPNKTSIDEKHIKFLLMMPYDLLDIKLSSRTFFDNLRRLITIERFLRNKNLNIVTINEELREIIKDRLYKKIRHNEEIEENSIKFLRKMIKTKLEIIEALIKKWEKIKICRS